jgi:CO/xanthine dehydrogenase FAD-binding subunit
VAEDWLRGRKLSAKSIEAAAALVVEDVEPLEDLHAAADYRAQLAQVFTGRAIQEASRRVGR